MYGLTVLAFGVGVAWGRKHQHPLHAQAVSAGGCAPTSTMSGGPTGIYAQGHMSLSHHNSQAPAVINAVSTLYRCKLEDIPKNISLCGLCSLRLRLP